VVQPFFLWHQFLKDDLVQTSDGDRAIVSYAAYDDDTGELNVFVINKETSAKDVNVSISSKNTYGSAKV
jgi:alpha-L-arabinofuranosidase